MPRQEESASRSGQESAQGKEGDLPENIVTVEEVGPARVKIKVEIPQARIEARLESDLDELRRTAAVPGFRVGHVPIRLIEKRFSSDTRDRLKDVLIAEALQGAIEEKELKTLGEPQLDFEGIEMPEEGPMTFEVETEIEPAFDLPELKEIAVTKTLAKVEDEDIDATIKQMLSREGVYEPVEGPAEEGDQIIGDLWLKVAENEVTRRDDMALLAGPTKLALMAVELNDLCQKFVGAKSGDQVTAEVTVADDHTDEDLRGKKGSVGMAIKEIKRLKIPPLTEEWLKKAGWEDEDEFRAMVRNDLERQAERRVKQEMRGQIRDYLLSRTSLELPENLSAEQIQQAENRQLVRLMQMGIPEPQAREAAAKEADKTRDQALDETKLFFILNRVAEEYQIEVDEAEINGQIAGMAAMYQMRPEKLRQQLIQNGRLKVMASQIQEQKVLDKLIEQAKITETQEKESSS